jgi:hypothetical protein
LYQLLSARVLERLPVDPELMLPVPGGGAASAPDEFESIAGPQKP